MSIPHLFLIVLVNLVWGSLFVMATLGLSQFPPLLFTALRFALLAVVLIPFLRIIPGQMKRISAISVVMGIAMYVTLYLALAWADSTAAIAMAGQIEVPIAVLLGIFLLGERASPLRMIGTGAAFAGIMVIGFDPAMLDDLPALGMITLSAGFYAVAMILVRGLDTVNPFVINAWMAAISTIPLLILSYIFERDQWAVAFNADIWGWGTLFYSAFIGSLVGHGGMYYLLRFYPVGTIAPFTLLTPLFAVIGSILFLGDTLTVAMVVGGLMILGGVASVNVASSAKE
ncbi:MAG: DMT family transporter [Alphaproteobacteria bacterium]|nr:DMT family transporter [Alphaproteobacteria bacterium]